MERENSDGASAPTVLTNSETAIWTRVGGIELLYFENTRAHDRVRESNRGAQTETSLQYKGRLFSDSPLIDH